MNRREALGSITAALAAAGITEPVKTITPGPVAFVIESPLEAMALGPAEIERLKAAFEALYKGSAPPGIILMPPGFTLKAIEVFPHSAADVADLKTGKLAVEDIRRKRP